jgi:arsenite methyltransferase
MKNARASYGADGYKYIVGLTGGGAVTLVAALCMLTFDVGSTVRIVGVCLAVLGVPMLLTGLLGLRYVIVGKFRHRDRLLEKVAWSGHERVLDVGTGGGLLLIGAAKRAQAGLVIGIDIWDQDDLSGNTIERTLRNVALEHVEERVEIKSEDVRTLSFESASFDVIVSMLCIHNIPDEAGQDAAIKEIARVLASGGIALISDLANTKRYAAVFRAQGLEVDVHGPFWDTFPLQHLVEARKPMKGSTL